MIDFKVIRNIRKRAVKSMQQDSNELKISTFWKKMTFWTFYYILPVAVSLVAYSRDIKLSSLEQYVGATIAIFTALFFSLLLNIGTKIKAEKDNPDRDNNNFQKFKANMKQIANITLYVIILGVVIFLFMLLNSLLRSDHCIWIEKGFTIMTIYILTKFIVSLFFIIQRFYFVISDEINNIL